LVLFASVRVGSTGRPIGLFPLLCLFCLFAIVLTISVCLSPAIRCDRCRELRPATDFPVAPRGNRYRTCLRCRVHPRLSSLSCWLLTGRRRAAAPLLYNQLIQMLLCRPVLAVCGHLRSVTGPTTPVRVDTVRVAVIHYLKSATVIVVLCGPGEPLTYFCLICCCTKKEGKERDKEI
jgi:hypothetical protein